MSDDTTPDPPEPNLDDAEQPSGPAAEAADPASPSAEESGGPESGGPADPPDAPSAGPIAQEGATASTAASPDAPAASPSGNAPQETAAEGADPIAALQAHGAQLAAKRPPFINGRYLTAAAIHAGVAVVSAVIVATVALVLLILEAVHASSGSGTGLSGSGSDDDGFTFGTAFRVGLGSLLSLSFGGSVHASSAIDILNSSAKIGVNLHGAPALITAAVLALTVWGGIVVERRAATPSALWRLGVAAATGLVSSGVVSILAATLGHGSASSSGDEYFSGDIHLSAGGPGVFLTGWLLFTAAAFLGRQVATWGGWRSINSNAPASVRDLGVWATALGVVFGILALANGVVYGIKQHAIVGVLLSLPLWLGQATVYAITLGHFGSLSVSTGGVGNLLSSLSGSSGLQGLDQGYTVLNIGGLSWILFGFAVLVTLWSGLRIGVLRAGRPSSYVDRGVFVVLATAAALIIPLLVTNIRLSATGGGQIMKTLGALLHGSLGSAGWAFLVFTLAAVLIDLIATYVAPLVAVSFPPLLRFAGIGLPTGGHGAPAPLSPAARKGTVWAGSVVGGLAVLAGLFFGTVAVLNHTVYTPEKPVAHYLDLIAAGEVKDAVKIGGGTKPSSSKPTKTISNVKTVSSKVTGDHANVTVSYRLGGKTFTRHVSATKTGGGLFNTWKVSSSLGTAVSLRSDANDDAKVTVGGHEFTLTSGDATTVTLLPGTYDVKPKGGKYLTADSTTVSAASDSGNSVSIHWSYTDAATGAVQKAVNRWIDENCFGDGDDSWYCYLRSETQRNDENAAWDVTWSKGSYPTVQLNADGTFSTTRAGKATAAWQDMTFDDDFNEVDTDKKASSSYYVDGTFSLDSSGGSLDDVEASTDVDDLQYQDADSGTGS